MSEILVNLIIQAIGGAIGGNAIGATLKNLNLGPLGNTIAGALGGAGGGSILSALIPPRFRAPALAGQFVGGGVTGAIVTAVVGAIVNGVSWGDRERAAFSEFVDYHRRRAEAPAHYSRYASCRACHWRLKTAEVFRHWKERVVLVGTDQRITSGPAAKRLHPQAGYMAAPERVADSQIPLAPRAPSIHGPWPPRVKPAECPQPAKAVVRALC